MKKATQIEGWVPIRETKLAKEIDPRRAGILFNKAGLKKMKKWCPKLRQAVKYVEDGANVLTLADFTNLPDFTKVPQPAATPSYEDLVRTIEEQTTLIQELQDELHQLRKLTPNNGVSGRARLALTEAGRHLKVRY